MLAVGLKLGDGQIIIATLASIAFATSAIAVMPFALIKKQTAVNMTGQIELAAGGACLAGGFNSKDSKNTSKADKGSADPKA